MTIAPSETPVLRNPCRVTPQEKQLVKKKQPQSQPQILSVCAPLSQAASKAAAAAVMSDILNNNTSHAYKL